jgi:hypothetical protein
MIVGLLLGAKEHEMHHRAQLMLIERQLGIIPHLTRQMNAMIEQLRSKEKPVGAEFARLASRQPEVKSSLVRRGRSPRRIRLFPRASPADR